MTHMQATALGGRLAEDRKLREGGREAKGVEVREREREREREEGLCMKG